MWLIGSRALAAHWLQNRAPRDFDVMCKPSEVEILKNHFSREPFTNFQMTESSKYPGKYHIRCNKVEKDKIVYGISFEIDATDNESRRFLTESTHYGIFCKEIEYFGLKFRVPKVEVLYCFKRSHANYPVHVGKTISDLVFLQKHLFGDEFERWSAPIWLHEDVYYLYSKLKEEAKERNQARDKRISFNKPVDQFFNKNVDREFDHDTLHKLTCRYETPLFEQHIAIPGHALIDMDSFFTMSFENQVTMVQEEAVVIGMERYWQFDKSLSSGVVFQKGLYKLLSDLCKGKFQDFALDNIQHVVKPRWSFMETFSERYGRQPSPALQTGLWGHL
jgi:hypothetical protein